jgi:hypothetical protein
MEPVLERQAGCRQVPEGVHDSTWCHVASRIVVTTDDQDARMVTPGVQDEVLQVLEVIMVSGEEDAIVLDRIDQMERISGFLETDVIRAPDIMAGDS